MTEMEKLEMAVLQGYSYDNLTGFVYGIHNKQITNKNVKGYIHFGLYVDGKKYMIKCHRFAWYYYYGEVPNIIDHKNRIKDDNRLCNLRNVTLSENQFNRNAKGYFFRKRSNKWEALICVNGKQKYLGVFKTETEASNAYLEAKSKYHLIK